VDKIVRWTNPMTGAWGRLAPIQKAVVSFAAVMALVALIFGVSMAGRPQYSVLFSNLSADDAGAIVEKLKESKVDYRLAAGGSAIEVPEAGVYDLRLQLAGEGLPRGGTVGFEVFDKSSFGMTEFTQKLNYQRALQGELAKTVSGLEPVAQARVHLAIPEQTVYADQQSESTASVVVKLRPGGQLGPDQVAAVTNLVSAAVEGLKPENVAVVDTAGNLLSDGSGSAVSSSGIRLSASQHQMQKQYEAQVARDLQVMLEKVLGPGKAIVRVNARMNFDSKQIDREVVEPLANNQGLVVSQEQTSETYRGAPRGTPGFPALSPTLGAGEGAVTRTEAGGDNYVRTQSSTRYEVTRSKEHVVQAPGKLERLSVAVLMDGSVTDSVRNTVENAVSVAAGLDTERGDQVIVDSMPFDTSVATNEQKEMAKAESREWILQIVRWVAAVLMALVFLLVLRSILSGWKPVEVTRSYPEPLPLAEAEALELTSSEPAGPDGVQHRQPAGVGGRGLGPRSAAEIARENPQDAARLVRSWLSEG